MISFRRILFPLIAINFDSFILYSTEMVSVIVIVTTIDDSAYLGFEYLVDLRFQFIFPLKKLTEDWAIAVVQPRKHFIAEQFRVFILFTWFVWFIRIHKNKKLRIETLKN